MAESIVNVTEGSGKKLHTFNRTIGANSVEDEVVLLGEPYLATYSVIASGVVFSTAGSHCLQIMAGGSLKVRVRRISVSQRVAATTAAFALFQVTRLTTAGTGGGVVTPRPFDSSAAAAGATAMTAPTVKGTEGVILLQRTMSLTQTVPVGGAPFPPHWEWTQLPNETPIIIPAGAANGLTISTVAGYPAASGDIVVELDESNF